MPGPQDERFPKAQGLYDPAFERDACGVGFVAQESGAPSHEILERGLWALFKLSHRGAVDADEQTGDGAGVLTQLPLRFFTRELEKLGRSGVRPGDFAVGTVFFPRDNPELRERGRRGLEHALAAYGFEQVLWRSVPMVPEVLGDKAARSCPEIKQCLVLRPSHVAPANFERSLYLARKEAEQRFLGQKLEGIYIPSLSSRTIVYKGLFMAGQLRRFYPDLQDPLYETALTVFHQRYSTNTFPTWSLAQPFRYLGHNGEINTIEGNRNWMRARTQAKHQPAWPGKWQINPIVTPGGSDSASLDNAIEALHIGGRDLTHSVMMLIPEPWQHSEGISRKEAREFYEYCGCLNEAWDGPAAVVFSDGRYVGGVMDRNGLRPMRFKRTSSGVIVLGSEFGILDLPDCEVIEKGRVGPGRILVVDTKEGKCLKNNDVKSHYFNRHPYGQWVQRNMVFLGGRDSWPSSGPNRSAGVSGVTPRNPQLQPLKTDSLLELRRLQMTFNVSKEELDLIIQPMGQEAKEPVLSMGDDIPLAVLSERPQHLARYFKQKFAQVTNPPIDPIREAKMMTLNTYLGKRGNIFTETPEHAHLIRMPTSMIWDSDLETLENYRDLAFKTERFPCLFSVDQGTEGLEKALHKLCNRAAKEVDRGARILILSDRGVDAKNAPIPMLLATAAVHHHLIRVGKRLQCSLIADTGDAWDVHHFASLVGYGASVVNPYLALHSIRQLCEEGVLKDIPWQIACGRFHFAIDQGMLKVMSKMGISTLSSYRGAQVFDALGLNQGVIDSYFTGTPSKIGGIGLPEIARDVLHRHKLAFGLKDAKDVLTLPAGGNYQYRRGEEAHAFEPQLVKLLQKAVIENDAASYKAYAKAINERPPLALRDLLALSERYLSTPISIDEVEPVEVIRKRFGTPGMSLGALSREAHESLAIAMNRIGARSNSGEGGEDPIRFKPYPNGDLGNSNVKQVASGRFGVTPEYLISADELQIKMAQGSKPGEGGQLPGHKVSAEIAGLRFATPGVPLISPPPHHDIYSIEDLAQLIYDLRQINPRAKISVKLVSLHGVGTIAAGVAKANADIVSVSGHDGGTGASPLSSIKNTGLPWELGLAEAHQTLMTNDLRARLRLRVDGGFKTGLDVVKGAILGADEFDFGSMILVAQGCVMVRKCHLNTCPTGVATQDPALRKKFAGTPERAINYFTFIAQEVREILAQLGARTLQEIIGRTELLEQLAVPIDQKERKASTVDLSLLLFKPQGVLTQTAVCLPPRTDSLFLHEELLEKAKASLEKKERVVLQFPIQNEVRTAGARLSYEITRRYGPQGLPPETVTINFSGSAGQSFGAFSCPGMRLNLEGDSNDYVGKGMAGGLITIRPQVDAAFDPTKCFLAGNTVLYGATGGELFIAGRAGERFAVRNSGATAVVEGVGHHGCEYMTRGCVVILGRVSGNLGAGMTGGVVYVYDEEERLAVTHNPETVEIARLTDAADIEKLRQLVARHEHLTESVKAGALLKTWPTAVEKFWRVFPRIDLVAKSAISPEPVAAQKS